MLVAAEFSNVRFVNFAVALPLFMHYFLVAVCKAAWYDDSNCFVAGFIDGVICLATKDPDDQVKIVEAHKVSPINSIFIKIMLKVKVKPGKGSSVFCIEARAYSVN